MLAHTTEAKASLLPLEQLDHLQLILYGKVQKLNSEQSDAAKLVPEINQLNEAIILLCQDLAPKAIPEVKQIDADASMRRETLLQLQAPDEGKRSDLYKNLKLKTEYYPLDAAWLEEPQEELPKLERDFARFFTFLDEQKVQPLQLTTDVVNQAQPQSISANKSWDVRKLVVNQVFSFFSNKELVMNRLVSRYWNNEINSPLPWKALLKRNFGIVMLEATNEEAKKAEARYCEILCHRLSQISYSQKDLQLYKMIIHSGIYFPPLHWVSAEEKTHLITHLPPLTGVAEEKSANSITRCFYYQEAKKLKNTALVKRLEAQDPNLLQQDPSTRDAEAKEFGLDHLIMREGGVGNSVLGLKGVERFNESNAAIQRARELFDEFMTRDMTEPGFNKNNQKYLAALKAALVKIGFHFDNLEFVKWLVSPERHYFQCTIDGEKDVQFIKKPRYIQFLPADSNQKKSLMLRLRFGHYALEGQMECLNTLHLHFDCHLDYIAYTAGITNSLCWGHFEATKELHSWQKNNSIRANLSSIYEDMLRLGNIDAAAWLQPQLPSEALQKHRMYRSLPLQSLAFIFGLHEKSKKETTVKMTLKILSEILARADKEELVERMLNEKRIVKELEASVDELTKTPYGQFESLVKDHICAWYCFEKIDTFVKIMKLVGLKIDYELFLKVTGAHNLKLMMLMLRLPEVYNAYGPMKNFDDNGDRLSKVLMGVIKGHIHSHLGMFEAGLAGHTITPDNDLSALIDFYNKVIFKYIEDTIAACKQNERQFESTDSKLSLGRK